MMRECNVVFRSFADVQQFVSLASRQPFEVFVCDNWQKVDAKSFMVMFSLNYRQPLRVNAECSEEAFGRFMEEAERFLA